MFWREKFARKFCWSNFIAKLKTRSRSFVYSNKITNLFCAILQFYMWLVFLTSRKKFVNYYQIFEAARNKKPLIISVWHNRLMMFPFITLKPKKLHPNYNFMTLASKHGDGRFVGRIIEKFGLISILGSTQNKKHRDRGITISSLKQIFSGLKKGYAFGITPDGPRGPNQKINGEIVNIARISGAKILPASCSFSRFIELKTWDKFKLPLPFSRICFYFDDELLDVPQDANEQKMQEIKILAEKRMDLMQEKSWVEVFK